MSILPPEARLEVIADFVRLQAEDEGLWFEAETAPEAYLQRELRVLHGLIEGDMTATAEVTSRLKAALP